MASKNYTQEQFIEAVKNSYSYSGVCRILGISPKGGNLKTVKNKIQQLELNASHFTGQRWNRGKTSENHSSIKKKDISEILVENSGWSSGAIRQRLIKEGLKESKCECCGRSEWMGIPIPLELHHINEIHTDNRLENLLILCPNCHAMTDSHVNIQQLSALVEKQEVEGRKFRGALISRLEKEKAIGNPEPSLNVEEGAETRHVQPKSRKKQVLEPKYCEYCGKELEGRARQNKYCSQECSHKANGSKRPDVLTLLEDFKELKSFVQVSKKYGVTDNAVRKWCKLYGILDKVKGQSRPQTK